MWDAIDMPPSVEESARRFRERALQARADRAGRGGDTHGGRIADPGAPASGARAWLIGSLVWGGFGERSDVDLVLSELSGAAAMRIEEAVARAARVEVDVLYFEDLPKSFQKRIEQEGVLIHGG